MDDRLEVRITDKIKTTTAKNFQPFLVIPFFSREFNLMLSIGYRCYLHRTQDVRTDSVDQLLLTFKRPIHPASTQRISKWIKSALEAGGVDIFQFSSYSTRHAATSAAYRAGVSVEAIRKAAGWTEKSNMFNRFYIRPLCTDPSSFGKGVLNSNQVSGNN